MKHAVKRVSKALPVYYWNGWEIHTHNMLQILGHTHALTIERSRMLIYRTDGVPASGELHMGLPRYLVRDEDKLYILTEYEFSNQYASTEG